MGRYQNLSYFGCFCIRFSRGNKMSDSNLGHSAVSVNVMIGQSLAGEFVTSVNVII